MSLGAFLEKGYGKYQRVVSQALFKGALKMRNQEPLISFSFDDFPRSAVEAGAAILEKYAARATYYTAFGLMGKQSPVGEMFSPVDLQRLLSGGHELGCHTFGHDHAWDTKPAEFENSIIENKRRLSELCPGVSFRTLSYPISGPRPHTKRRAAKHFACCRFGGQTYNVGVTDRYLLRGYFLEQARHDPDSVKRMIDSNSRDNGWLIFATHDISETPTRFGCTPDFFEEVVRHACGSRAKVLPVGEAWDIVSGNSRNAETGRSRRNGA